MTDKARELLERAYYVLGELSYAILKDSGEYNLAGDIYEYLASEKQDQSDTLEKIELPSSMVYPKAKVQQVAAILPNEEEVDEIVTLAQSTYEAVCATENRLVRKNQ